MKGFYKNMSFRKYLEDESMNSSGLKIFSQSPAKFKYWEKNHRPATQSQIEGSALHCSILEPEKFQKRYGKGPAPRIGSAGRTKWDRTNPTALPLTPAAWDKVHSIAEAFEYTPCTVAKDLLSGGVSEVSIFWEDQATGLNCKIRPDYLREDNLIVDLKSTINASPGGFLREIKKWGYQYQAAFYLRGLTAAYQAVRVNRQAEAFVFVAIESTPPYEVACYVLSETIIQEANIQIDECLAKYRECLDRDEWPGYSDEIIILGEE